MENDCCFFPLFIMFANVLLLKPLKSVSECSTDNGWPCTGLVELCISMALTFVDTDVIPLCVGPLSAPASSLVLLSFSPPSCWGLLERHGHSVIGSVSLCWAVSGRLGRGCVPFRVLQWLLVWYLSLGAQGPCRKELSCRLSGASRVLSSRQGLVLPADKDKTF